MRLRSSGESVASPQLPSYQLRDDPINDIAQHCLLNRYSAMLVTAVRHDLINRGVAKVLRVLEAR